MENKKFWMFLSIFFAISVPWYFLKHHKKNSIKIAREKCDNTLSGLIKVDGDVEKLSVCSYGEFDRLITLLKQHLSELNFIQLLPKEEQYKIYKKFLKEYVIVPYLVAEFLKMKKITENIDFVRNRDLYLRIMENNFNINAFQEEVGKEITVEIEAARKYYAENQKRKFNVKPFIKESGGITASFVAMQNNKKTQKEYEALLKSGKDVLTIDNFYPEIDEEMDPELKRNIIDMKTGEFRIIKINNRDFMIYKAAEKEGIWQEFEIVENEVKAFLKRELIEKRCNEILANLEKTIKIEVCDRGLTEYIKKKSAEKKLIPNQDEFEDEKIPENEIKRVTQESKKIE